MSTDTAARLDTTEIAAPVAVAYADPARTGARVEHLLDELAAAGADTAATAEELVRSLMGLYGAGLARIMRLLAELPDAELAARVSADELVSSLLIMHDLHPRSTRQRVETAVADLRRRSGAHLDTLELAGIDEGVAQLRFPAVVGGCPATHATLVGAIEAAIRAAAPELAEVVIDTSVDPAARGGEPTGTARRPGTPLIPVESLRRRPASTPDTP